MYPHRRSKFTFKIQHIILCVFAMVGAYIAYLFLFQFILFTQGHYNTSPTKPIIEKRATPQAEQDYDAYQYKSHPEPTNALDFTVMEKLPKNPPANQVMLDPRFVSTPEPAAPRPKVGPDFLFFGNAKCGTTSFFAALGRHPQVVPSKPKEINYWVNMSQRRAGLAPYHNKHFPPRSPNDKRMYGDGSILTITCPGVAPILYKNYPNLKLIAAFRHPVKRAISHYQMCLRNQARARMLSFDMEMKRQIDHMRDCDASYADERERLVSCYGDVRRLCEWSSGNFPGCDHIVMMSMYPILTQEWKTTFPRDQIFWFDSTDFYKEGARVLQETFDFLGLTELTSEEQRRRWAEPLLNTNKRDQSIPPEILRRGSAMLASYLTERGVMEGDVYFTGLE